MSGDALLLVAASPPPANKPLFSVELWVAVGLLSAVLLGGAVVLYLTDLWRKRQLAPDRDSPESLTSFRAMYERGDLSEEEYQKIRARVAAKVKQEVAAANPSMAADTAGGASPEAQAAPGVHPEADGPPGGADADPRVPPTG